MLILKFLQRNLLCYTFGDDEPRDIKKQLIAWNMPQLT